MKEFKGIYKGNDLSNDMYHSEADHLSSSNLKMLLKDREKFYNEKVLGNRVNISNKAFDEGSLVHCMILEEHLLDEEFVMFDGFRKAGKVWDAFKANEAAGKGRTILSKPQWMRCVRWVEAYKNHPTAVSMVNSCDTEYSLFAEYMGVKCKVRADCINVEEGYIVDVKTTSYDIDVDSFKFTMKDFGYELSAAFYCSLFEDHYGKPFDFYFIVLGKKCGGCEVYKISKETRELGNREVHKALKLYKQCKKSGIWKEEKVDLTKKKCYNDYIIEEV